MALLPAVYFSLALQITTLIKMKLLLFMTFHVPGGRKSKLVMMQVSKQLVAQTAEEEYHVGGFILTRIMFTAIWGFFKSTPQFGSHQLCHRNHPCCGIIFQNMFPFKGEFMCLILKTVKTPWVSWICSQPASTVEKCENALFASVFTLRPSDENSIVPIIFYFITDHLNTTILLIEVSHNPTVMKSASCLASLRACRFLPATCTETMHCQCRSSNVPKQENVMAAWIKMSRNIMYWGLLGVCIVLLNLVKKKNNPKNSPLFMLVWNCYRISCLLLLEVANTDSCNQGKTRLCSSPCL